jgi:hypothetical protein
MPVTVETTTEVINISPQITVDVVNVAVQLLAGPQGPPGQNAQDPVFTVSTGAAGTDVQITGTYPNQNLQIPRGSQGIQGDQGIQGPQGIQGIQGVKGDTGDIGPQGIQGIQGNPGADAEDPNFTVSTGSPGTDVILSGVYPNQNIQIPRGNAGTNGVDGKTVRNGSGAPSGGLGVDGDFYIDTTADAIYGPKTAGAWGSPTSLIGPTGSTGSTGAAGPQGPQGNPGTNGIGLTTGIIEIDFGATPSSEAEIAVTGLTDILSTSTVDAVINGRTTADNNEIDHEFASIAIRCSVVDITAGVGFTIKGFCIIGLVSGKFKINWRYSP